MEKTSQCSIVIKIRIRMQRIYKFTQICCVPESLVLSLSTLSAATQDTRQIKTAKEKKETLEISISEKRNDRNGKHTSTFQCRKEMTEDGK